MDFIVHQLLACKWNQNYGKCRVELAIVGSPKRVCWLTATQRDFLMSAFDKTPNGYSCKEVEVVAVFGEKGYYKSCYARVPEPARNPKHNTPLIDHEPMVIPELLDTP